MKILSTLFALTLLCGLSQSAFAQAEAPADASGDAPPKISPMPEAAAPAAGPAVVAPGAHYGHGAHYGQNLHYGNGCNTCCQPACNPCCRPRRSNPLKRCWDSLCRLEKKKNAWLMDTFFGSRRGCNQCCPQPVYCQPQPCCGPGH